MGSDQFRSYVNISEHHHSLGRPRVEQGAQRMTHDVVIQPERISPASPGLCLASFGQLFVRWFVCSLYSYAAVVTPIRGRTPQEARQGLVPISHGAQLKPKTTITSPSSSCPLRRGRLSWASGRFGPAGRRSADFPSLARTRLLPCRAGCRQRRLSS